MELINGDCLDVIRGMEPNSVDAIVTDPPYGLEFMGKEWDRLDTAHAKRDRADELSVESKRPFLAHSVSYQRGTSAQDWHYAWAVEALRVAKPGCHLLAFGGTRTFHRLACAIEDAGWEIRDTLMYVYGSGFPKSHNIGCKCGGGMLPYSHDKKGVDSGNVPDVRQEISKASMLGKENEESLLQLQLQREGKGEESHKIQREHEGPGAQGQKIRPGESGMEGRRDVLEKAWKLQANQICPLPDGISTDGPEGRIYNGASASDGDRVGSDIRPDGSCPSQESQSTRQPNKKSRSISEQSGAQNSRICPKCGGLIDWVGFGSALKPAFEPIILARKPLDGTLRQNVQKWGCGSINIDGCRVGTEYVQGGRAGRNDGSTFNASIGCPVAPHKGRWPANLIHDGSEEVLELFPESKSTGGGGHRKHGIGTGNGIYGEYGERDLPPNVGLGDSGSAARFFYCAKSSRAERERGCEGMEERDKRWGGSIQDDRPHTKEGYEYKAKARNHHPTVKPLALMRYLCRLVTPPNGIILDPFMGSGTTGMAAKQEGFRFIGIEKEKEYCEIARKRINGITAQNDDLQQDGLALI